MHRAPPGPAGIGRSEPHYTANVCISRQVLALQPCKADCSAKSSRRPWDCMHVGQGKIKRESVAEGTRELSTEIILRSAALQKMIGIYHLLFVHYFFPVFEGYLDYYVPALEARKDC